MMVDVPERVAVRPEGAVGGCAGAMPFPLSGTVGVGLAGSLVVTTIPAERAPVAAGLKVTVTMHFAFAASGAPHPFACVKSPEFVPVIRMLVIVSGDPPAFVSDT